MVMMEHQQTDGSVRCDRLPPLSAKYPWLVVQKAEDNFGNQVFLNLHNPLSQYCYQIPELVGRRIRGFFHGWVILSNNVMWSLWNPSNSKVIRLPPLRILNDGDYDDGIIGQCCLTSPLGDPGSILLLTRTDRSTFVFCRLDCERKKLKWTEMSYAKQLKRINNDGHLLHSLTCCDGKVYALNTDGCLFDAIIIIDIVVEDKEVVLKLLFYGQDLYALCKDKLHVFKDLGVDDYSWEKDVAEAPKSCCTSPAKHFLTKQDQYLLLVIVSEESIEVFKLNDSTKTWGKVDGIGHHMIYISDETCLCVEAKTLEMGNKIYFSELLSRNGRILFYSLETCTYGTFNNKTIQVSHTIVRQLRHPCTWIEPSWS